MNKHVVPFVAALLLVLCLFPMPATAIDLEDWLASLVGDPAGWKVVAQDGNGDYTCIQAAINDYGSTEILVMPGIYKENILITKDIVIRAYDGPKTTVLDGSRRLRWVKDCGPLPAAPTVSQDDVILVNPTAKVTIEGLCITNGQDGIEIQKNAHVTLRNCVFWANKEHGIYIQQAWPYPTFASFGAPTTLVYNCICVDNGSCGIYVGQSAEGSYCPPLTVMNTILIANDSYGIALAEASSPDGSGVVSLDYNCYTGNLAGNYGRYIGPGQPISEGKNSISLAPNFINGNGGDFRLRSNSPCVNHGSPGAGFMDPDGTVNDMGAYGGPGAATFFDNPTDGPLVRCVEVSPGSVPQGSKLTIKAVGSVR